MFETAKYYITEAITTALSDRETHDEICKES